MPKLYYPTPDELQGAVPLNENLWMRQHQGLMLALANTSEGKDLLCIEDNGLPIIGMRKNVVLYDQGDKWMADFRVGAKWGNVVRYRWQEVRRALNRMNELAVLKAIQTGVLAGAATLTQYPDPHPETTTIDGFCATGTNNTFQAMIAQDGETKDDTGVNIFQGFGSLGGLGSTFSRMRHASLGFDTSAIGAGEISSATFSYKAHAKENSLTPSGDVSLIISAPASNTALALADYQDAFNSTTLLASEVDVDTITADDSAYTDHAFSATGRGLVVGDGVTNIGWMMKQVVDGTAPTGGNGDLIVQAHSADETGTSEDPKLVVEYTVSFTPKAIMF